MLDVNSIVELRRAAITQDCKIEGGHYKILK